MNVFDLDRALTEDYERFARSFTRIRAEDLRTQIEALYATDRFWPEPLVSINPRFERGKKSNFTTKSLASRRGEAAPI